ncbi:MAG TPA: hypothetical protein VFD66_04375 [Verrucomicrobiae bacterium]|nr:hypothetical protein [Verrucomicrobiae bacterium]
MRLNNFILLVTGCMLASAAFARDDSKVVPLSDTPVAVQKAIRAQAADGTLGEIDRVMDDGGTLYDVELTARDGSGRDFTVDENGKLVSIEVLLAETPAPVQKAAKILIGEGKLESVDKLLEDAEVTYDFEVITNGHEEKGFTLAADGTLLSAEVALNETPDAVRKAIQAQLGAGTLEHIEKNFDEDGISYDVDTTTKEGREKSFTVAADGSLASAQVTLEETTPAAQKTIKDQIGNGKILRIDKSFTKERGVLPYHIEGRKDGKPFDFSVGPRGKFLGMND